MTVETKERMLDAMERASELFLQIQNDRHWPARRLFLVLLGEYIKRVERRLAT
jgi:hypothetical protein